MTAYLVLAWACLAIGFRFGAWWAVRPSAQQRRSRILPMEAKAPTLRQVRILSGEDHG